MTRWVWLGSFLLALAVSAAEKQVASEGSRDSRFVYGGLLYVQKLPMAETDCYPEWNPGESACPLHPTNALALAINTASNLVPNTNADLETSSLLLRSVNDRSFYEARVRLTATYDAPETWSRPVTIVVGVDGTVPPIKTTTYKRFGGGFRRATPGSARTKEPELTPEEMTEKREEVQENLRQYQMAVIRAGMPPLPMPLTEEMDKQLVNEGILPPIDPAWTNTVPDRRATSGLGKE